jgi:hypothetical protein
MRIPIKPSAFMQMKRQIMHCTNERCFHSKLHHFHAFFGILPSTCTLLWSKLESHGFVPRAKAVHLLWTLLFLNLYNPKEVIAGFLSINEQTYWQ